MSGIILPNGQPASPITAPQPIVGDAVRKNINKFTNAQSRWVEEAYATWVREEIALTEAFTGDKTVAQAYMLPAFTNIPILEADGSVSLSTALPIQLQLLPKEDVESALRRQPRWGRNGAAFVTVKLKEDDETAVDYITGFIVHRAVRVDPPKG